MPYRIVEHRFLGLLIALLCGRVNAADNLETLLGMLESRAQLIRSASWEFETVSLKGRGMDDLPYEGKNMLEAAHEQTTDSYTVVPGRQVQGIALFDLMKGRYKLEIESTQPREGGTSKFYSERRVMSFDGEMYVDLIEPVRDTKNGEKSSPPRVVFDRVYRDIGLQKQRLFGSGFAFCPQQFPLMQGIVPSKELSWSLIDFTRECKTNQKVKFTVRTDELWVVSFPLSIDPKLVGIVEYRFNPKKGGAIESLAWIFELGGPACREYIYDNEEWVKGFFGPSEVLWIDWGTGLGRRTRISNVKLNEELDEKSFKVTVPIGATVNDQEHQMIYTASKGPIDEAQSISKYVELNDVSLTNVKRSNSYFGVIASLSAVAVLVCMLIWWRRRATLCLALFLLGQSGCNSKLDSNGGGPALQLAEFHSDFVWDNGWKWSFSDQESLCVSQCGFTVSTLALRIQERPFEPSFVSKLLTPTTFGTRMSDIKHVLEAHGLEVQARSGVNFEDLFWYLDGDAVAIVHKPSLDPKVSKQAHYTAVIRDTFESLLYLDPPYAPLKLSLENRENWKELTDLTVLICKKDGTKSKLRADLSELRFNPKDFVDGKFSGEFQYHNDSAKPVLISSVSVPCSCVSTEFQPLIAPARDSVRISLTINGRQWGFGNQSKSVTFFGLEELELAKITLSGQSVTGDAPNLGRRYSTKIIEVPLNCPKQFEYSSVFPLFDAGAANADLLSVSVDVDWCRCKAVEKNGKICLQVDFSVESRDIQDLLTSGRSSAFVSIKNEGESIPIYELSLNLQRDLEIKSSTVHSELNDAVIEISAHPSSDVEWLGWDLTQIEVDANEVAIATLKRVDEKLWRIECKRVTEASRPFVGKCLFEREGFPPMLKPILIGFASP